MRILNKQSHQVEPVWGIHGRRIVGVIGSSQTHQDAWRLTLWIIKHLPKTCVVVSRDTVGVDRFARIICQQLGRAWRMIRPMRPLPKWPLEDKIIWYAQRSTLCGKRVHALIALRLGDGGNVDLAIRTARHHDRPVMILRPPHTQRLLRNIEEETPKFARGIV